MQTTCWSLLPCRRPSFRRVVFSVLIAACALFVAGCGGGSTSGTSGGGGGGNTNPGSFTLSLSASTLTLTSSASQTLTVTVKAVNGFSGSVYVMLSGLPVGVNASPSSFSLSAAGPQQIQLTQNSSAATGTSTIMVLGSSGTLSAQAQFTLIVQTTPSLTLTLLPASFSSDPGGSQMVEAAVGGSGGLTGTVTGTVTGLPAGVTVDQPTFSTLINSAILLDFNIASTATTSGVATVTVTNGTITASATLPITITTAPDFVLSSGIYTELVVYQSATASFSVTAAPHNGFDSPIAVSFAGIPTGVTFSPSTFNLIPGQSQTITVVTTFNAVPNSNPPPITVIGTGGGITHQSQFALSVIQAFLNLNIQPTALTVPAGSTNQFDIGYSTAISSVGTVSIQLSNVPSGVTLSSSSYTAPSAGAGRTVFVEASSTAVGGTISIAVTYGPTTQTRFLPVTIGAAEAITPVPLSTADQLVPTDALTPYTSFPEPNYLLYHAASNRFFSTDAYLNQLNVVDAATRTLKATLSIPGAFGIDQAPNGSVLYIGTTMGDIYIVDPISLVVLKRIPSSSISPYGFTANAVYALANGSLLLETYFLVPGYSWVDGNGPLAVWNPSTNSISLLTQSNSQGGPFPQTPSCLSTVENVVLTNNRSRVLLLPVLTDQGSSEMCSLDPIAGTWNWSPQISGGTNSTFTAFAVTSDGSTLVTYDGFDIYVLDASTLTLKSSFPVPTSQTLLSYPVLFLSADNRSVFLQDSNGADVLDVYNLASGKMTGWIPETNITTTGSYSTGAPLYQGITASGLAAGVIQGGGIGLLDTTAVHPLPIGSRFSQTELDVPYGPVAGGTASSWRPGGLGLAPPLGSIYFGANAASGLDDNTFNGMIAAVSPAGTPGPVDVRTFASDGGSQFLPRAFSYGPSLLETVTSYATADGGGPASLYGFGFGPQLYAASSPALSNLQVTIGGSPAVVNSYNPNPYGNNYFNSPPFPTNALLYTVPSGVAGTTATIAVNNMSGSTTSSSPLTYLPAVQQYSLDGQLVDGVYDPTRDVYYFTDTNQIRVFSLTRGVWLTPIPIPVPPKAYGPQRLWGIALSPDGSKLAVADLGAVAIYIINPDQPSSIQSFALAPQIGYYAQSEDPTGVAILNNGTVYFTTADLDGDGSAFFMKLDPSTGIINAVSSSSLADLSPGDTYGRLALSADGERIYTSDEGLAAYYDIPSGQSILAPVADYDSGQGSDEVVLSANQTRLFSDGFLADSNLNNIGYQALDVAESVDASYVYGAALSADGSLLFQPGTQAIDVFDGNTGTFRARISLPVSLSPNYRALVSNNQDSRLVAITGATGSGIAVIDLNSLPEPAYPAYLSAVPAPVSPLDRTRPVTSTAFAAGKLRNHSTIVPNIQRLRISLIRPSARTSAISPQ